MIKTQVGICVVAIAFFIVAVTLFERIVKDEQKKQTCYRLMFAGYCGAVLWITLLSRQPLSERIVLLRPFESYPAAYQAYLTNRAAAAKDGVITALENIRCFLYGYNWLILNIMMFIPYGILVSRTFARFNRCRLFFCGMIGSVGIEIIQYISRLGCFDIDDLIQNAIGIGVGLLMNRLLQHDKTNLPSANKGTGNKDG